MKQGLDQIHSKSLLEFFEKRQLHPMDALRIMSISSLSILASYIEYDMTGEERTMLGEEIDKFAYRLRELLQASEEDLFAILLAVQMLQREMVDNATKTIEQAAKEAVNGTSNTPMSSL